MLHLIMLLCVCLMAEKQLYFQNALPPCVTDTCVNEFSAEIFDQFSEICDNIVDTGQKENENGFPDIMHDAIDNVADSIEVPLKMSLIHHALNHRLMIVLKVCIGFRVFVKRLTTTL